MLQRFEFVYQPSQLLPRLSWCAELDLRQMQVVVTCGPWVECRDDFFVEGAWTGNFTEGAFADALIFAGSGARVVSDGIVFSTASHPLEPMYYTRSKERIVFSNSLALLLAQTGIQIDEQYPHYLSVIASPRYGTRRYSKQVPVRGGVVEVVLYRSIKVGSDGTLHELPHAERGAFRDFQDYHQFLVDSLSDLWANARDPARSIHYGLISTVSSGYDSTACAALAREIGGREALTFRDGDQGEDDSGAPVAQHLGMEVHEFGREDGLSNTRALDEFASTVEGDLQFAACEHVLEQKICLTGYFGDTLWGKDFKPPWGEPENLSLVRADFAGGGMTEFRLRVGFIHVPVAMLGMTRDRSIWTITHSAEMRPWTLGNNYDRPIARRIAEEAGVPRELFGQSKKVTATGLDKAGRNPEQARYFAEYRRYEAGVKKVPKTHAAVHNTIAKVVHTARRAARLLDKKALLPTRLRSPTYAAPLVPIRFLFRINKDSYIVPWALGRLRDTYRTALKQSAESSNEKQRT